MKLGNNSIWWDLISREGTKEIRGTYENDKISILRNMESAADAATLVVTGEGNDVVFVGGKMAGSGFNTIVAGDGNKVITVVGGLDATRGAVNEITAGEGTHIFSFGSGLKTGTTGSNAITTNGGTDTVSIVGGLMSEGTNKISLGNGLKTISIGTGMRAMGGVNEISMGEGKHILTLAGVMNAAGNSHNTITGGNGDSVLTFVRSVEASGVNRIEMGDGRHVATFASGMNAYEGGTNAFYLGNGDATITFTGRLRSEGLNDIALGDGRHVLTFACGMSTGAGGINRVVMGENGKTVLTVAGVMESLHLNEVSTGNGNDVVTLARGMAAGSGGENRLETHDGDDRIIVSDRMQSRGLNVIDAGDGNNDLLFARGFLSDGGENHVISGAGNDVIRIIGNVDTVNGGSTLVSSGAGDDRITVDGAVGVGGLVINAGEGYDTLTLGALTSNRFSSHYKNWLTDLGQNGGLDDSGLELIRVDVRSSVNAGAVDWLSQIINEHNSQNPATAIDLELNVDGNGCNIYLSDLFGGSGNTAVNILDMGGIRSNTLKISGLLSDNGFDDHSLRIKGDANDTVFLHNGWESTDGTVTDAAGIAYNVYTNSAAEELLVQASLHVTC